MILNLISGRKVEVKRKTTAHYTPSKYGKDTCNWNINIIELVNDRSSGFIAIGEWGCDGYHNDCDVYIRTIKNFNELIPIDSIESLSNLSNW